MEPSIIVPSPAEQGELQEEWQRRKLDLLKHESELHAARKAWRFLQERTSTTNDMHSRAQARMQLLEHKTQLAKDAVAETAKAYFYFDV